MVAAQDPLVRALGAGELGDHVVGRGELPVELQAQVDARRPRAQPVGHRQGTPPLGRGGRPSHRLDQRPGVGPGDRQDRDPGEGRGALHVQALGVARRPPARGQRVARVEGHVRHRAALGAELRPEAAARVGLALDVAVVARIGEDEAADGPVLRRHFGLDAAPGTAVARQNDLAAHVDAAPLQLLVVAGDAVVDVDQLAGHVAVDRVGVVDRQLLAGLPRGGVFRQGRLGQAGAEAHRRFELEEAGLGGGEEHLELLDRDLVAPGPQEPCHEVCILFAPARSDVVRIGRHLLHPGAEVVRPQGGVEAGFELALAGGALGGEADERRGRRSGPVR